MAKQQKPVASSKRIGKKEKEAFTSDNQPAPSGENIGANRRILIVDDNLFVLKAFEQRLKADGFQVSSTTNPAAVANLAEQSQTELVVLDLNFPPEGSMEWSGLTVIQWLRRFPRLASIPLIVVSGVENPAVREQCLAAGVNAFFLKPVVYAELKSEILDALGRQAAPQNGSQSTPQLKLTMASKSAGK